MKISILLFLVFSTIVFGQVQKSPFVFMAVIEGNLVCIESERPAIIGGLIFFDTPQGLLEFQIRRKLSSKQYEAVVKTAANSHADVSSLRAGISSTLYDENLCISKNTPVTDSEFWLGLENLDLDQIKAPVLSLLNSIDNDNTALVETPLRLSMYNFEDCFCALMAVFESEIYVLYPNALGPPQKAIPAGEISLTMKGVIVDPVVEGAETIDPWIGTSLTLFEAGDVTLLTVCSNTPRPLSEWIPDHLGSATKYYDLYGTEIHPSQIGPGLLNSRRTKYTEDNDADFLYPDTWTISSLKLKIENP